MAETKELAMEHTAAPAYLLQTYRILVHREKSVLNPTQILEYLGMVVDTIAIRLCRYLERRKSHTRITSLLRSQKSSAREVSKIIGEMSAMSQGIPPGTGKVETV